MEEIYTIIYLKKKRLKKYQKSYREANKLKSKVLI